MKRLNLIIGFLMVVSTLLAACGEKEVEVTRVVTEKETVVQTVVEKETVIETVVEKETVVETVVEKETIIEKETVVEKETVLQTVVEKETVLQTVVEKETVVETVVEEKEVVVTPTPPPFPLHKKGDPVRIQVGVSHGPHLNALWAQGNWCDTLMTTPVLFTPLVYFNVQGEMVPKLAEEVEISDDATVYTFHLNPDAVWSDGEPITAEDVAFTYRMALDPVVNSPFATRLKSIKGGEALFGGEATELEGVTIIDDHTVQFELEQPDVAIIRDMWLGILPEHILGDVPSEEFESHPFIDNPTVTSGPFEVGEIARGDYYLYNRKEDYWGKSPGLETLIGVHVGYVANATQLEAGELDIIIFLDPTEVDRIKEQKSEYIDVVEVPGGGYYSVRLNHKPGHFTDVRTRQAIAHILDRQALVDAALGGRGEVVDSSMVFPEWAKNPNIEPYEYDPELAKELLAEAAADGAWDPDRELTILVLSGIESWLKMAEIIQQELDGIGVKAAITLMTGASWMNEMEEGDWDIFPGSGGTAKDPSDAAAYPCDGAGIQNGYCNPELDALMQQGRTTGVVEERQAAYWAAAQILHDELPEIPVATASWIYGLNKGIGGIEPSSVDYSRITWNIEDWFIVE
jgi:peptide/nickel transport system substrate-binding protein